MARTTDNITQSDHHNARGIELADRGWYEEAIREFHKAIELDPKSAHAHDNLGTVLTEKGLLLEALAEFVVATQLDPNSATTHHYLASFLASHGPDLAISQYRRSLACEYEFPDAHLNLAMTLADTGRLDEALRELEIAHLQAPEDTLIQHELACCLIDLERHPDAIAHLKNLLRAEPRHIEALVDLGIAYTAQGFYAEAESSLHKALAIDPVDFNCHYHLAALYATWARPEDALDHLEAAARQDSEKIRTWLREDHLFDPIRQNARYLTLATQ